MSSTPSGRAGLQKRRRAATRRSSIGLALLCAACTLTRDDYEPREVSGLESAAGGAGVTSGVAGEVGSPPAMSCGAGECCSTDEECAAGEVCDNGACRPCASGEDLSACQLPLCPGPACPEASCSDGVANGRETGVDCGGGCPETCVAGTTCNLDVDCASGLCSGGSCAAASCDDAVRNGGESDVDCGPGCPSPCPAGASCASDTDCESGLFCAESTGLCTSGSCQDGAQSGNEVLADCGGGDCPGCPVGSPCSAAVDCDSRACVDGVCVGASCADQLPSGDETGVDCGGSDPACEGCGDGESCSVGADCASGACENAVCVSCEDGDRNGTETDVDCGGSEPSCSRCDTGDACLVDDDCDSGDCGGGRCQAVSCDDDVRNGAETDVDCGGSDPSCARCADGDSCVAGADCESQRCQVGTCVSCSDGVRNGTETGVDCGGTDPSCDRCGPGLACNADGDCASGACEDGVCCGGSTVDCTRCALRLSTTIDCDAPAAGTDSTGVINCSNFLACLADNADRCPTRNTSGCSGDNQAADACPHNDYGGNAGTGLTRANQVLQNAGCQL